jgi:GNAT superfamily N-acetyltransferase
MNDVLLDNHLAFFRRHRGEISQSASGYALQGTRPEFTYAVALRDGEIERNLRVVHRPDFGHATAEALEAQGFRRAGALRYMTRSTSGAPPPPAAIRVEIASSREDADVFADVQTRGFLDGEQEQAEWHPVMREAALRNIGAADQTFFVARIGDVAAGVTLTVTTEVVGVYAVATPPAFRKRGIATALLHAALRQAAERGQSVATLQVAVGSDAERLYSSLGFTPSFTSEIWRRDWPRQAAVWLEVVRYVDDSFPGFVECRLVDAAGVTWTFIEKVPVITLVGLDAESRYPQLIAVACNVVDQRRQCDGTVILAVDTASPDGLASTSGEHRFEVFAEQIQERAQ